MENIQQKNEVIALFIGLILTWNKCSMYDAPNEYELEINNGDFLDHDKDLMYLYDEEVAQESFKFHYSWDWLMPVVEKIESMGYEVEIEGKFCFITEPNNGSLISGGESESKILAVHEAVYQFIKQIEK